MSSPRSRPIFSFVQPPLIFPPAAFSKSKLFRKLIRYHHHPPSFIFLWCFPLFLRIIFGLLRAFWRNLWVFGRLKIYCATNSRSCCLIETYLHFDCFHRLIFHRFSGERLASPNSYINRSLNDRSTCVESSNIINEFCALDLQLKSQLYNLTIQCNNLYILWSGA